VQGSKSAQHGSDFAVGNRSGEFGPARIVELNAVLQPQLTDQRRDRHQALVLFARVRFIALAACFRQPNPPHRFINRTASECLRRQHRFYGRGLLRQRLLVLGGSGAHRRKLLAAITALRDEKPAEPVAAASAEAERRQLTVMFCDLVGSTPMSARHDPEDLREILGAYHRCVAEEAARFGGYVAK
jgi:hypothetical protein